MAKVNAGDYGENFGEKFQDHILAVAARHPSFTIRYRSALDHTYFASEISRITAKALFGLVDEHRVLPSSVLLIEEAHSLVDEDSYEQIDKYIAKLFKANIGDARAVQAKAIEFGKTQALVNAVIESADFIDKGQREKVMGKVRDALIVGEDITDVGMDYAVDAEARARWYQDEGLKDIIPSGISHLDYALGGGPERGELYVILAPPKKGKSTTLINIGFGALRKPSSLNVVHYTFEMSEKKVIRRYDDRLSVGAFKETDEEGKPISRPSKGSAKHVQRLTDRAAKFIGGRLFVKGYPTRTAGVTQIRSHLSFLETKGFYPDLIIVDYADIMKPERRLGEMRHEQAGIYEDLRTLAGEYHAVLWTGSQAKAGALEKDTLEINDFAEAFEKAAVMDGGIGFCQTPDERIAGECRLVPVGLRGNEDGRVIRCRIRRDFCYIRSTGLFDLADIPQPTDADYDDDDDDQTAIATRVHKAAKKKRPVKRKGAVKKKKFPWKKKKGPRKKDKPSKKFDLD